MKITTGKKRTPLVCIVHGNHGVGKTHFATTFPDPLFIGSENLDNIKKGRYPKIKKWDDFIEQLKWIKNNKIKHKTLVIDSLDGIQYLKEREILSKDKAVTMNTAMGGYDKAWSSLANDFMDVVYNYFDPIVDSGMNLVLICHSIKKQIDDLISHGSYSRYETKLYRDSKGRGIGAMMSEWVPNIFYMAQDLFFDSKDGKKYADTTKERKMYTSQVPSIEAKNRIELPDRLLIGKGQGYDLLVPYIEKFYKEDSLDEFLKLKEVVLNKVKTTDESKQNHLFELVMKISSGDLLRMENANEYLDGVIEGKKLAGESAAWDKKIG